MSAIGPGDWVECVKSTNPSAVGKIFRCVAVYRHTDRGCVNGHKRCDGIDVEGMVPRPGEGSAICAFRPIYRPKTEIIEALKQPAPAEPEQVPA